MSKFEYLVPRAKLGSPYDPSAPPAVRRFAVPGGWLYQVQKLDIYTDDCGVEGYRWHPPTFVPGGKRK